MYNFSTVWPNSVRATFASSCYVSVPFCYLYEIIFLTFQLRCGYFIVFMYFSARFIRYSSPAHTVSSILVFFPPLLCICFARRPLFTAVTAIIDLMKSYELMVYTVVLFSSFSYDYTTLRVQLFTCKVLKLCLKNIAPVLRTPHSISTLLPFVRSCASRLLVTHNAYLKQNFITVIRRIMLMMHC